MKIHIARMSGDPNMVKAFRSVADMNKWVKRQEQINVDDFWDIERIETHLPNTKQGIIDWFNEHGWHQQ